MAPPMEAVLSVSSLLLDDTFQPVTPLIDEALRQFAPLRAMMCCVGDGRTWCCDVSSQRPLTTDDVFITSLHHSNSSSSGHY